MEFLNQLHAATGSGHALEACANIEIEAQFHSEENKQWRSSLQVWEWQLPDMVETLTAAGAEVELPPPEVGREELRRLYESLE